MKVSLLLVFLQFLQPVHAQYNFSALDTQLESVKKEFRGKLVTMIYKDGKIIYQNVTGEFNAKSQEPIASCSKWLTAALVMIYVDEGKLSLDDKVSKYLPIFSKYGKGYITIRDCLSHLTGIASEPVSLFNILKRNKYNSLEEEVDDFASKKEIQSNPGLEFRYSSVGLNIAGRVLEVMTRRSFDQLMREKITVPLMMRNTSFSATTGAVNPSGGAVSTASDYLNFLSMILHKGTFNGKRILSEKAIADMQTARTTPAMIKYAPKAAEGYNYGFGEWILETDVNGVSTVVTSPGLFGTWPLVDNCRGYACIFFTKGLMNGEEKRDVYLGLKKTIDSVIPSSCK